MRTALTIAGSDSSGGAGIQADIKTMISNGVYAMSAITALTAQNTTGVTGIMEATPEFLADQLDNIFTDIYPDAVKEVTNPTRIVTTTVRVKNGSMPVVSVKTAQDIPKEKIFDCVEAPVQIGDVILENVAGTGVDIVATGNVKQIIQ